jgi:hypothetical protein
VSDYRLHSELEADVAASRQAIAELIAERDEARAELERLRQQVALAIVHLPTDDEKLATFNALLREVGLTKD